MGAGDPLYADFYMPYVSVGAHQRRVPVSFFYSSSSDRGLYPIPPNPPIEPGTPDRHVIVIERDGCKLYELYKARRSAAASAGRPAPARSGTSAPTICARDGWTSADAAGCRSCPGSRATTRSQRGEIDHAIRFTRSARARRSSIPRATRRRRPTDPKLPPMGLRVRLKASFDIATSRRRRR